MSAWYQEPDPEPPLLQPLGILTLHLGCSVIGPGIAVVCLARLMFDRLQWFANNDAVFWLVVTSLIGMRGLLFVIDDRYVGKARWRDFGNLLRYSAGIASTALFLWITANVIECRFLK